MSTPTTVIFDVANVIVDWAAERALRGFLPDADVDAFLDSEIVWEVNAASDAGVLLSDCVDELAERAPELVPTYRVYLERFPLTVSGPEPGTTAVIDRLLRAGVPAYGLSNWSAENFDIARRGAPVLGRLREVLVSGEIGLAKPDPAIFRYALRRWELPRGSLTLPAEITEGMVDHVVWVPTNSPGSRVRVELGSIAGDIVTLSKGGGAQ